MSTKNASIRISVATLQDSDFFYDLRNDVDSRLMSLNKSIIPKTEHDLWFRNAIINPHYAYYIGELNQVRFGYVRFESQGASLFKISIAVAKAFRGMGLSSGLLSSAIMKFKSSGFSAKKLSACVQSTNIASIRIFESNGFKVQKIDEVNGVKLLTFYCSFE